MTHDYAVFGGRLRSALAFPELRAAAPDGAADWTLHVAPSLPLSAEPEVVGSHQYAGDVRVRLLRTAHGLRVETSDIGAFDLAPDGVGIVWRAAPGAREDLARFDVLGRVLPILLHQRGALVLHGSSVVLPDGGAVALLGAKGQGKSTLALALAQRGARLLSDDATVIAPGRDGALLAHPGVHAVRLWADSADRLAVERYGEPGSLGRKLVVPAVPDALLAFAPAPLHALYLLSGQAPQGDEPARREPVSPVAAAVQLVRQTLAGGLLGGDEAARTLERAARAARAVPVYALHHVRDFARLDDVADAIAAWHAPRAAAAAAAAATAAAGA